MKLVFSGLEAPIDLAPGYASTLQIANETLFVRIISSLASSAGSLALEPYTLWDDGVELRPSTSLMVVQNPLQLPWDDRSLMGEIVKRIEREFLEDEDLRRGVEAMDAALSTKLLDLGFGMNSDYGFGLEWEL